MHTGSQVWTGQSPLSIYTVDGSIAAFLDPVLTRLATGGRGWRNYLALDA